MGWGVGVCSCARRRAGPPGAGAGVRAGAWGVISYQSKQQNVCRRSVGLQTPVRACAGIYFVVNSRCLRSVITPPTYTPTRPCSTSPASRIPEGREATGVTHAVAARGTLRRAPVSSAHFAIVGPVSRLTVRHWVVPFFAGRAGALRGDASPSAAMDLGSSTRCTRSSAHRTSPSPCALNSRSTERPRRDVRACRGR